MPVTIREAAELDDDFPGDIERAHAIVDRIEEAVGEMAELMESLGQRFDAAIPPEVRESGDWQSCYERSGLNLVRDRIYPMTDVFSEGFVPGHCRKYLEARSAAEVHP